MQSPTGRDTVALLPFPESKLPPNLPPKQPTPTSVITPPSIPVFNRSGQVQGFSIPPYPYIGIRAGAWTTQDVAKKDIPRNFALQHLRGDANFNVQIPYERLFASDEKHLTVAACIDELSGWGICNSHIIKELAILRGESVGTDATNDWSEGDPLSKCDLLAYPTTYWNYGEDVPEITKRLMRRAYKPTKWGLALTIPTEIGYIPVKNLVLMSMWEGNSLPDGWGEPLRQYVKHLIVPCQAQKDAFAKEFSGEIDVVPLGVDTNVFAYRERPQRRENEPFTILLTGSPLTSRKSPIETIVDVAYRAFGNLYGDAIDNWKIILKTRDGIVGAGRFKVNFNDPHIQEISHSMTRQQLADLCYKADIGINLSKYEGAGLIPLEQMSTGLPVILSNHSGLAEVCDPMFNLPIDHVGMTSPEDIGYESQSGLYWYVPDYEAAARELRYQYNLFIERGRTQSAMGERAAEYIRRKHTWRHTAEKINDIVNRVIAS